MGCITIVVYVNDSEVDRFYLLLDRLAFNVESVEKKAIKFCDGDFDDTGFEIVCHHDLVSHPEGKQIFKGRKLRLVLNALHFSYIVHVLQCSSYYRFLVISHFHNVLKNYIPNCRGLKLCVTLIDPPEQIMDYMWCQRITSLVMERSELDSAMSWLSTLGGAYSALGDQFSYCAQMAGRISLQQFKLAIRLGDESTVARCKLYIALSLIQNKRFKSARRMIEAQYRMAMDSTCPDTRLIRMCRGVWSKLRYERSRFNDRNKNNKVA